MKRLTWLFSLWCIFHVSLAQSPPFNLAQALSEVAGQSANVSKIIDYITSSEFKHVTYERLAAFTDTIGPRLCGSKQLEAAVEYMLNQLQLDGLENVHAEPVILPQWVRGNEYAKLISPRLAPIAMLGLGSSVGTGPSGITAPVLVVSSFDELKNRSAEAKGKIVVYNQQCDWKTSPTACYGATVGYRGAGASQAAQYGALAALVRTVGGFSIRSPHTGGMHYDPQYPKIPTAEISIEDADLLARMQRRGQEIVVTLYMEAQSLDPVTGHNVVAELTGSTYPDEVVIVSGHLDSWDVGQGAMDDGGGAFISWSVLSVLKNLGLRPKRTIRLVMWSCEEFGGIGGQQYYDQHKDELPKMDVVMESDMGVFKPYGLQFTGNNVSTVVMGHIAGLLAPINATTLEAAGDGTDIDPWMEQGVPGVSLANYNDKYFWFHHSQGDMMTVLDPDEVDLCAVAWTAAAFAIAELSSLLPRP